MDGKIQKGALPINILVDPPPSHIDGCRIETNYRTMILFAQLMLVDELPEEQRLTIALENFWIDAPKSLDDAIAGLIWFYRCGDLPDEEEMGGGTATPRAYDFDEDAGYIYAAFLQQYGIDLQNTSYMHWWKFMALFNALNKDCRIVEIMQYRLADTSKMPPEQRQFYNDMKKAHRLKKLTQPEKEAKEIAAILAGGGDLSQLLGGGGIG